jgi:DUF2911 family protein
MRQDVRTGCTRGSDRRVAVLTVGDEIPDTTARVDRPACNHRGAAGVRPDDLNAVVRTLAAITCSASRAQPPASMPSPRRRPLAVLTRRRRPASPAALPAALPAASVAARYCITLGLALGAAALAPATTSRLHAQHPARADSNGFITRLGGDTLAVERVVTTVDSITGEIVGRSPKTARYSYSAHLTPDGRVSAYSLIAYQSLQGGPERVHVTIDIQGDSAHAVVRRGDSTQTMTYAAPKGLIPLFEPAFGLHQIAIARTLAAHGQRVPFAWVYLPKEVDTGSVMRGPRDDTVRIATATDTIRAVVDGQGHVLAMSDLGGTLQATVVRTGWLDLDRFARDFAARDARGKGLGMLSPRDTVRATIGGSELLVDYSRPTRRGRQIFGAIVPWNTVWRTGANAATTFVTSRDIMIGDTHVPAGTYTLFSVPTRANWTLIVSRKTGEWGTDYDSSADLARIPMQVETAPRPAERFTIAIEPRTGPDATLSLAWDTVVARVPLRPAAAAAGS